MKWFLCCLALLPVQASDSKADEAIVPLSSATLLFNVEEAFGNLGMPAFTVLGWEFEPREDILVTALGWRTGFEIPEHHRLGIFSSDALLIASSEVEQLAGEGTVVWSEPLELPLLAGERYTIAGTDTPLDQTGQPPDAGVLGGLLSDFAISPHISFLGERRTYRPDPRSVMPPLVFPDEIIDRDYYANFVERRSFDFSMGPTFQFTVVPEPASRTLLLTIVFAIIPIARTERRS